MLSDPLTVPMLLLGLEALITPSDYLSDIGNTPTALITLRTTADGDGNSKRKGELADGTKVLMTISHSQSKENAPYLTDRLLVRYDFTRIDANGRPVVATVYQVTTLPQGGIFSKEEVSAFAQSLSCFTLLGSVQSTVGPRYMDPNPGDTLERLLGGEA